MTHHARFSFAVTCWLVAAALLAACSGGGGGAPGVLPVVPSAPSTTGATLRLIIPVAANASRMPRRPAYVSPSTQSALIAATWTNAGVAGGANVSVDLSAASNACANQPSGRTCNVSVTVPLTSVTFNVTTYDLAPVSGAIPASAHVLGRGSAVQTISLNTAPINIVLEGVVGGYGAIPAFASLPADGAMHTYAWVLNPVDFDNNPIATGPGVPYANPIVATLTESGGSGHSHLIFDGAASGTTATLSLSTDTVSLQYDGGGAPGYSVSVSFNANGATAMSTQISPLYVTTASGLYTAPNLALAGGASSATFAINELNAPVATVYTATPQNCAGVATVGAVAAGPPPTFTVTGTGTSGNCSVLVSDGTSNVSIAVTNTVVGLGPGYAYIDVTGAFNAPANTEFGPIASFPVAAVLAAGGGGYNVAPTTQLNPTLNTFYDLALDPKNGILWMENPTGNQLYGFSDAQSGAPAVALQTLTMTVGNSSAQAADANGNHYGCVGNGLPLTEIEIFTAGATTSGTVLQTAMQSCTSVAVDANGYIYATDSFNNTIDVFAKPGFNAGMVAATLDRQITSAQSGILLTEYIALDSAGQIYVSDGSSAKVWVLAAGETGAASPIPLTSINVPAAAGVAIDANNDVIACNGREADVYSAAQIAAAIANHTVVGAPLGKITGANTLMANCINVVAY